MSIARTYFFEERLCGRSTRHVSTVVLPEIYEPSFCEMIPDMLHFANFFFVRSFGIIVPSLFEILSMISVGLSPALFLATEFI